MDKIKTLLKFGKRENIIGTQKGELWFSTAERLRPLEEELVKGQGDRLEGGMHIVATAAQATNNITGCLIRMPSGNITFEVFIEPVKTVPMYCLFACYDKDVDEKGNVYLSKETQEVIHSHFPDANAVAVITDPYKFITEIKQSIHSIDDEKVLCCKSDFIHYFHMKGFEVTKEDGNKVIVNDQNFLDFLIQGIQPVKVGKYNQYAITSGDAWRNLFCKDVFFNGEQEYRFILPNESVNMGKLFKAELTEDISVYDLDEFFS